MPINDDHEPVAAIHESGHAVACLSFGFVIVRASIADGRPHLLRSKYFLPPPDIRAEALAILCLSGSCAERLFCGAINDGSDRTDIAMARRYLADSGVDALRIGVELNRHRMQLTDWCARVGRNSASN